MSSPLIVNCDDLVRHEAEFVWGKETPPPEDVFGIAASGGGIRSATVTLGAIQALAENSLLERFSYLSTVSGGGYIGSALSWFWAGGPFIGKKVPPERATFGCERGDFPFQVRPVEHKPSSTSYKKLEIQEKSYRNLDFLRHHGSYLTSADHIGYIALIVSIFRTVLISLFVWVPPLVFLFYVIDSLERHAYTKYTFYCAMEKFEYSCSILSRFFPRPFYSALIYGSGVIFVLFMILAIILSLVRPQIKDEVIDVKGAITYITGAAGLVLLVFFIYCQYNVTAPISSAILMMTPLIVGVLTAVGVAKFTRKSASYMLRRLFDRSSGTAVPIGLFILALGMMPNITAMTDPSSPPEPGSIFSTSVGTLGLLSGVGTAVYGYYIKVRSIAPGISAKIITLLASIFFVYGLILICFVTAHHILYISDDVVVISASICAFLISLAIGSFSSVNSNGLHRFYRDRLMETFLPDASAILRGDALKSDAADTFSLTEMWKHNATDSKRPYHIVNAHAILTNSADAKVALRGGDNFILSAGFVGSEATGWMRTDRYIEANGPLTLASAMAASGAAANANAGYIGTGLTRERWLSIVMSLLNIRLGLWIPNPRATDRPKVKKMWFSSPTYFGPAFCSGILNFGYHEKAKFLELSDGGHFENLGIYELIRRKLRVIVAIDGEQDGSLNLSSLVSSINRVREDFGAVITFSKSHGPALLLPRESRDYPDGVKISQFPFIVADIRYRDGSRGVLIYIKATMTSELEFCTRGYRAANPDFPHQTTADQFFDPEQFEAYRDLGMKSCRQVIELLGLKDSFDLDIILRNYHSLATED